MTMIKIPSTWRVAKLNVDTPRGRYTVCGIGGEQFLVDFAPEQRGPRSYLLREPFDSFEEAMHAVQTHDGGFVDTIGPINIDADGREVIA
jgi:hypothetical protein